jgi:hypothetical protein
MKEKQITALRGWGLVFEGVMVGWDGMGHTQTIQNL